MLNLRLCVYLMLAALVSAPALAKDETLAERGMRMCEEAGIPLEDCKMLPPVLRGSDVAAAKPETLPMSELGPQPAAFGTGKYGWCEDCTSILAAAPVTPWGKYGGRQFQPIRDEDEGRRSAGGTAVAGNLRDAAEEDDSSEPDDGGESDSDSGESDDGDSGENGGGDTGGGSFCE